MKGLGVGSLHAKNLGLLGKWKWSGASTLFWKDTWLADGARLMDQFPRLYALDLNHDAFVKDRWRLVNGSLVGNWDWRAPPRGHALTELSSLLSGISGVYLDDNEDDKWTWNRDASGYF
ncbi:hypothetical protein Tco_0737562 [Tanacetum coccineum]